VAVGLACALALYLAAPLAVTAQADAISPSKTRALALEPGGGTARAGADGPAVTTLQVVSHNIEKRQRALRKALRSARRTGATVVALQELCGWQAADLVRAHPDWTVSYRPERDHVLCERSGRRRGSASDADRTIGNAVVWTGGSGGRSTAHTFSSQRSQPGRTGMPCVSWTARVVHTACSVHLSAPVNGEQIRVRTGQARDVRDITRPWVRRGRLVVLAGDFNAEPHRRTMDHLYARGGSGSFREAGPNPARSPRCACYEPTLDQRGVKIDYVFFSTNRVTPRTDRRLRVVPTVSDHDLLLGRADVDLAPR